MVIAADTSFLFALYGNDCHSVTAAEWVSVSTSPILISDFNDFELRNALRFSEFSKRVVPGTAATHLSLFENAIAAGRLVPSKSNLSAILMEAKRLSTIHTLTGGHRGFDILHVAAAKTIKASHFLTFDANQKKLAENEGLIVPL
jgi:predicted nucleic acid-binding protein